MSASPEVIQLLGIIQRAVDASDNGGGSASDAIQDMLLILGEADAPTPADSVLVQLAAAFPNRPSA